MNNILLFLYFTSIGYISANVSLQNVACGPHEHYVTVDDRYRYHLHMVKLHRCFGRTIAHPSYKCTPEDVKNVDLPVYDIEKGEHTTLAMANHTKCKEMCSLDSSICNNYQTFDKLNCQCECNHGNDPGTCEKLSKWDQMHCKCQCPHKASTYKCDKKKIFDESICGCVCRNKVYKDCSKQNKTVDENYCQCVEPKLITGRSIDECKSKGVSKLIVIVVVVFEAMSILIMYYIIDKYLCKKRKPKSVSFSQKSYDEKVQTDSKKKEQDSKSAHSNDIDKEDFNLPKKLDDNISVSTDTLETVIMRN